MSNVNKRLVCGTRLLFRLVAWRLVWLLGGFVRGQVDLFCMSLCEVGVRSGAPLQLGLCKSDVSRRTHTHAHIFDDGDGRRKEWIHWTSGATIMMML